MESPALVSLSAEDLSKFLLLKSISGEVVENLLEHGVDGEAYLLMSEEHLKEVAPRIVDRIKLKKIETSGKENTPPTIPQLAKVSPPNADDSNCCSHQKTAGSSDQWHFSFEVPGSFSRRTEDAIASGLLTKKVRTEIVQALLTTMIYTKETPSEQYNTVCRKLIERFPNLKDEIGASGYGSWKTKLRDRFKFLRRPQAAACHTTTQETSEPPAKRQKKSTQSHCNAPDDASVESDLATLQRECQKRKRDRSLATIQSITSNTFKHRRQWIQQCQPQVHEVIVKYPSLKIRKVFRQEFKPIVGIGEDLGIHSLMRVGLYGRRG